MCPVVNNIFIAKVILKLKFGLMFVADAALTPSDKQHDRSSKLDSGKLKWNQWSPLSVLTMKSEKKRTMDDSVLDVSYPFRRYASYKMSIIHSV